ncbi:MAG: hypothetical protein H6747_03610 [Deltaproteobacteria bacterium]|nr:hypothetical protein [Deltaproteobacteria bacterium]
MRARIEGNGITRGPAATRALAAGCALIGLLVATVAGAEEPAKRCGGEAPTKICVAFERSPRLPTDDPKTKAVVALWKRIEAPFAALTGRETGLVVLGPEGRYGEGKDAQPFPPAAYICPGAPPVVYVPYTLVDLVLVQKKYPVDFMAFVIGHELGHRANDFSLDGCQLAAFQRPGKGRYEEELADKRSAFFTAIGGYSTRKLAQEDLVSHFLQAEFGLRKYHTEGRKKSVMEALTHFDALESLYQTSVALALSGETQAAARLLSWAEELIRGKGVPLPELLVARALVLMMNAAPNAPWLEKAKLPLDATHLRCAPIYASHTALWDQPDAGAAVRGASDEREAARRALTTARKLLDEAAEMGASPLTIAAGRTCVAFYLGEANVAVAQQKETLKLVPKGAPPTVVGAVASNGALVDFLAAVESKPTPALTDAKALGKWGKQIGKLAKKVQPNVALADLVKRLKALPKRDENPAQMRPKRGCKHKSTADVKKLELPAAQAPEARKLGACPKGWKLAHTLPSLEVATRTGSPTGVTTCVPADGRAGVRWVGVDMPGVTSPPLDELQVRMRIIESTAMALPMLSIWSCMCGDAMQMMGLSDVGEEGYMVACDALGVGMGVVFSDHLGTVKRLVVIDSE